MKEKDPSLIPARLIEGLSCVIKGKDDFLRFFVACFLAGGHLLIEDIPGIGKTTAVKTLARLISLPRKRRRGAVTADDADGRDSDEAAGVTGTADSGAPDSVLFRRIQFTPDLLPYDITGVDVFNPRTGTFTFQPGPVFASIILADEINRTPPKVQAALLEVLAEGQVTIGGKTRLMDDLFFVAATMNPLETEGTYPLPVAERDRFMMRLSMGYPDLDSELEIVRENPGVVSLERLRPVCTRDEIVGLRAAVSAVHCAGELTAAAVKAARRTRELPGVKAGVSPRGSLMLVAAARGMAVLNGRDYVIDQDILDCAPPVFLHRMVYGGHGEPGPDPIREVVLEELKACRY